MAGYGAGEIGGINSPGAGGGGGIDTITSTGGTIAITDPTGPSTNLEVQPGTFVPQSVSVLGPPTTGTWTAGDNWCDSYGIIWNCVASGAPGTWVIASRVANPYDYGAKGDGVTNDYNALNEAINSGLPVYIPTGIFSYNSPLVQPAPGLIMFGAGCGQTNGATAKASVLQPNGCPGFEADLVNNTGLLQDFQINGVNSGAGNDGISFTAFGSFNPCEVSLTRLLVQNMGRHGIFFGANNGGLYVFQTGSAFNTGSGAVLNGTDCEIISSLFNDNTLYGLDLDGVLNTITHNTIGANALAGIRVQSGAHEALIHLNGINLSGQQGILVQGFCTITNNSIHTNSQSADNTYAHIEVASTVTDEPIISDNRFWYDGSGPKPTYDVLLDGSAAAFGTGNSNGAGSETHSGFTNAPAQWFQGQGWSNLQPGIGATTQATSDASNLVATDEFVQNVVAAAATAGGIPTQIVPLGAQLTSNYTLTTSMATIPNLATLTLPLGYWLVTFGACFSVGSATFAAIQAIAGTAAYTVLGGNTVAVVGTSNNTVNDLPSATLAFVVHVTTAGTVLFQADKTGTGTGTLEASSNTGYTAVPIGGNVTSGTTVVNGTLGSVTGSQPFQTAPYKKALGVVSSTFVSVAGVTYTYPTAFATAAAVVSNAVAGLTVTTTLTTLTVVAASALGAQALIVVEGY
jgi:hypothetical protein